LEDWRIDSGGGTYSLRLEHFGGRGAVAMGEAHDRADQHAAALQLLHALGDVTRLAAHLQRGGACACAGMEKREEKVQMVSL